MNSSFRLYKVGVSFSIYLLYYSLWFFLFKLFFITWLFDLSAKGDYNYNLFILSLLCGVSMGYDLMVNVKDILVVFSYIYLEDDSLLTTAQMEWKEFLEGDLDGDYDE
jgi:hypothetical protein